MNVKTWALTAAVLMGAAAPAVADTISVTGELVTIMCVTGHGDKGRGEAHVSCALKCAKQGYPLAVLTSDGTLYKLTGTLTADHDAALQSLLAKNVTATGTVGEEGNGKTLDATSVTPAK